MAIKVIMPQMGESVVEGTVGTWLKQEGDPVEEYEPVVEVETDKVTSEVTAEAGGTLLKIYVQEGATVDAGTVLALIGEPGEDVPEHLDAEPLAVSGERAERAAAGGSPAGGAAAQLQQQDQPVPTPQADPERAGMPHVTPVVARIAAEHSVDVTQIAGSGRNGRVTKKDIMAYLERREADRAQAPPARTAADRVSDEGEDAELAPWERPGTGELFKLSDDADEPGTQSDVEPSTPSASQPAPGRPGELVPHSTMRRRIAEHMVQSKLKTAPHVTTVFEADLRAVVAHRAAHKDAFAARGLNLTYTAYFTAATAAALREHPQVNSQWRDDGLLLQPEINIGMAVALDEGLIVPVVRRVDELSLAGIARQVNDLAQRARANQLTPDEVQGGTFTITNHGVAGSLFATPVINQPQTGILGVGAIKKRAIVIEDDAIAVRPMVYLSFTFDHRVLDGATADWFVASIVERLEHWPSG